MTQTGLGDGENIGRTTIGAEVAGPLPDTDQAGGDGLIDVTYAYDAESRLTALTDDNGNKTEWSYTSLGQKATEKKGISVSPSLADRDDADTTIQWTYNFDGTVQRMTKEDASLPVLTSPAGE